MRRQSERMGIASNQVGTELIDLIQVHKFEGAVTVLAVVAEQSGGAAAEWNIELDGEDLFAAEQSVAAADTPEQFIPDQNREAHDDAAVRLALDISNGDGNELNVSVLWDDGR